MMLCGIMKRKGDRNMNKTFLMVAIVLGSIMSVIMVIYGFVLFNLVDILIGNSIQLPPDEIEVLIAVETVFQVMGVFMIIIGFVNIIAVTRINAARNGKASRSTALGWSIYLLICAGLIPGLFGILGANQNKDADEVAASNSIESQIRELDALYQRGLISKAEYDERRAEVIKRI